MTKNHWPTFILIAGNFHGKCFLDYSRVNKMAHGPLSYFKLLLLICGYQVAKYYYFRQLIYIYLCWVFVVRNLNWAVIILLHHPQANGQMKAWWRWLNRRGRWMRSDNLCCQITQCWTHHFMFKSRWSWIILWEYP